MLRGKTWFGVALALLLVPVGLSAQTATITGSVRSQAQAPVRGAFVMIPGLEVSTLTNDAGAFLLVVPADRARGQQETLVVRQIGFRTQEITVTVSPGTHRRDIVLQEEAILLDEVVVTGTVGRQERKAQPAVVASIDATRTAQIAPVTSVSNLLQARVPGVSVQQSSGTSGTAQSIRIRGASSISLSNEPLVFIDGIRADSRNRQIYGVGGQGGTRLNDLRPDDIESIEIVKGPAAATLYGADASAGVIQIITKKGRQGGGFTQSVSLEYNTFKNEWTPPDNWGVCSAAHVADAKRTLCYGQAAGTQVRDNPLLRHNIFETGSFRSLSWSGRGGGENYGVYLSFGMDQEDGLVPNNGVDRMSGGFSFDFIPNEKVRIETGFRLLRTVTNMPQNDNNIYGYLGGGLLGNPTTVGTANDGWYAANRQKPALSSLMTEDNTLRVLPRLAVSYTPANWFTHRLSVGADLTRTQAYNMYPKNIFGWYGTANLNSGQVGQARESANRITLDYLANVTRHLSDDISADVSLGAQVITTSTDLTNATGIGLITNAARSVNAAAQRTGGQQYTENRQAGIFGQLHLGFYDRIFVQTGARLDKHSSFGRDAKAFLSPKIGVSYVLSEEGFWQDNMPAFFGTMRLRGAYGTTGRSPSSGALRTYDTAPFALVGGGSAAGVIPYDLGNLDLKPERGSELELGFDASFLDERLGLEVSYFNKKTKDLILGKPLPASLGFSEDQLQNIGGVINSGFEVAANVNLVTTENFAWSARAAMATLHNEITDMGDVAPFGTLNRNREGSQIRAFHTYRIRGYEEYMTPADTIGFRGIVSDTLEFKGNLLPSFEGTFASTFTIMGNLQVYAQMDRKSDFYIYNNTAQFKERQMGTGEKWVKRNDLGKEERASRFGPFVNESGDPVNASLVNEAYIEPGDFWRLREVSMTYMLPRNVANRLFASGASVTLAGRNLWLSTKYSGSDPELYAQTTSTGREDFLTMPTPRRWVARINLQF
jgi:TonB-linked SusC/RagA family outer membrane protein